MYALLIVPEQSAPGLITVFRNRSDFLSAVGLDPTSETAWTEARGWYRLVQEINDASEAFGALESVKRDCPDHYDRCRLMLAHWLDGSRYDTSRSASSGNGRIFRSRGI